MITQTFAEWEKDGTKLFGEDKHNWAFRCPKCDRKNTVKEFMDHKLDANDTLHDCIGRHVENEGCNWAAYGLFGTLGKGRIVLRDDKKIEVFDFYQETEEGKEDE